MSLLSKLLRCGLSAACVLLAAGAWAQSPPTIAAAADLQFAVEEIAARFQADSGRAVRLAFGSSGNFARQIEQGAPFALFMSADEELVFRVADAGRTVDRGTLYAVGRIVLMVPHSSALAVDGELKGLAAALAAGRIKRLAIANPEHAPYGRRAEEALKHAGLWEAVRPHLVLGENVAQAAQFAMSGNADGGIIAYSLALSERLSAKGRFALIPDSWHQPLRQRMVLLKGADETARLFYDYLQQPPARQILRRYGFALPGEQ